MLLSHQWTSGSPVTYSGPNAKLVARRDQKCAALLSVSWLAATRAYADQREKRHERVLLARAGWRERSQNRWGDELRAFGGNRRFPGPPHGQRDESAPLAAGGRQKRRSTVTVAGSDLLPASSTAMTANVFTMSASP